jgi:preprotein translocase subunit YajC
MYDILLMAPPQQGGNPMTSFYFIFLIIIVFYFFMIRPQMKKAKTEKLFRENLKKGDKVVTIGGIHGKIIEVSDKTFTIDVDNNVRLKIEKSAISTESTKQFENKPLEK